MTDLSPERRAELRAKATRPIDPDRIGLIPLRADEVIALINAYDAAQVAAYVLHTLWAGTARNRNMSLQEGYMLKDALAHLAEAGVKPGGGE